MSTEWIKPLQWDNEGDEPSDNLKANGFQAGQKPPASIFNHQWHKTEECITQLQDVVDTATEKLDGIEEGANKTVVDTTLSALSVNPISNRAVWSAVVSKAESDHIHTVASTSADGFMSFSDKKKLDNIASGANNYTHPSYTAKSSGLYKVTVDSTGHVSATTAVAKSDITALGIPSTNTTYSTATTSSSGLMSASDKTKLNGIEEGATKTVVDTTLSIESDNPIANKAVYNSLALKSAWDHTHSDATTSTSGFMSADDKSYIDGLGTAIRAGEGESSLVIGNARGTASGCCSLAVGDNLVKATGECSFAQGRGTASGDYSVALGYSSKATGMYSTARGWSATAAEKASFSSGKNTYSGGEASHTLGAYLYSYDNAQTVVGRYNTIETDSISSGYYDMLGSAFVVGTGYRFSEDASSTVTRKNGFRVSYSSKCYGASSFVASGADYAEYYEWQDGNPDNEDRRGRFVTMDGNKIKLANAEDDYILGVISAVPVIVGNSQSEEWQGMFLTDVFGERLTKEVEIPETTDEDTGEVIPAHTATQFIVNPEYDPTQPYKGRDQRKEWSAVGTHGQLVVIDDGTCEVNHYCTVAENGTATRAEGKTEYRVIERLDDTHIKIVLK